ncbi:hypothetical protein [Cryptosporangium phraense]|uniref:Uncharacterized protein n=1 Tax=Cryptosporangium phraense TaxID=2593070 RepID=A0A545AIT8_9ACTN|nr:hypothetical protein [Cryptosporangium phraense]TQS41247.1 hypothetical protein FL583_30475 [Cryptosporangium phraense]
MIGSLGGTVRRRGGLAAVIAGFFGAVWFGWARDGLAERYEWALILVIAPSFLVVGWGAVRAWGPPPAGGEPADPTFRHRSPILVGVEFVVAAAAAWFTGPASDVVLAVTTIVIGLHFVPLARLLGQALLGWAGAAIVVVGLVAWATAAVADDSSDPVAGLGTGAVLLAAALLTLRRTAVGPTVRA